MPSFDLTFHSNSEGPLWPDLASRNQDRLYIVAEDGGHGEGIKLGVLDGGMASGQPSVALRCDLEDGRTVIIQTSARLFCSAARAIATRYPKLFEGE
jgi:hypothetical protein